MILFRAAVEVAVEAVGAFDRGKVVAFHFVAAGWMRALEDFAHFCFPLIEFWKLRRDSVWDAEDLNVL